MVNSILKIVSVVLLISLISCKKDKEIIQDQIVIGVKEKNAITKADFTPIDIEESLLCQSAKIINFEGIDIVELGKCFIINQISKRKYRYQTIRTLSTSLVNTFEGQAKIHYKDDLVKFTDDFTRVDFDLPNVTDLLPNNADYYVAIKFGNDKQYIGWIKLTPSIDHLIVSDYCYYEVKINN